MVEMLLAARRFGCCRFIHTVQLYLYLYIFLFV